MLSLVLQEQLHVTFIRVQHEAIATSRITAIAQCSFANANCQTFGCCHQGKQREDEAKGTKTCLVGSLAGFR